MPNFNLLPWRETQRELKRRRFYWHTGLAVLMSIALAALLHLYLDAQINTQKQRNDYLQTEITQLEQQINAVKTLKSSRKDLLERIQTIEYLQAMRPLSVHLFDEIAKTLPDGMYLTHLLQKQNHIHLMGKTQSNTHVSEYLNQIKQSDWLNSSNLKAISIQDLPQKSAYLRDFDLQVTLKVHPHQTMIETFLSSDEDEIGQP